MLKEDFINESSQQHLISNTIQRTVKALLQIWSDDTADYAKRICPPNPLDHRIARLVRTLIQDDSENITFPTVIGYILDFPNVVIPLIHERIPETRETDDPRRILEILQQKVQIDNKTASILKLLTRYTEEGEVAGGYIYHYLVGTKTLEEVVCYGITYPQSMIYGSERVQTKDLGGYIDDFMKFLQEYCERMSATYSIRFEVVQSQETGKWIIFNNSTIPCPFVQSTTKLIRDTISRSHP